MILLTRGACVVAPGGCMVAPGGHAWLLGGACVVALGDMCGFCQGVYLFFFPGGMHGFCQGCAWFSLGGHAWFFLGGMHGFFPGVSCVVFPRGGMHRIRRDTVNERAVRILLECILVNRQVFSSNQRCAPRRA